MAYIDGFVIAAPVARRQEVVDYAARFDPLFLEVGATRVVEAWGDDVPHGKLNDLYMAVQAKDDEAVLFSWFEYPDKATRDAANRKMMEDPAMAEMSKDMPFDGSRMIFAGFAGINQAGPGGDFGYLDGVVAPVARDKEATYTDWCKMVADIFVEPGATRVVDTLGDDVPDGKKTDFKRATHLKDGEAVAYGWIEWPSKAVRDAAWERLMQDERLANGGDRGMDGKRMMFGGFTPILDL